MAAPVFDYDRISEILVDSIALGDAAARAKWKISPRSLERYHARVRTDRKLAEAVDRKKLHQEADWAEVRLAFLRKAIGKLHVMLDGADIDHMRDVAGAIKIVGDLHVVSGALSVEQPRPARASAPATPHGAGPPPPAARVPEPRAPIN